MKLMPLDCLLLGSSQELQPRTPKTQPVSKPSSRFSVARRDPFYLEEFEPEDVQYTRLVHQHGTVATLAAAQKQHVVAVLFHESLHQG